MATMPEPKPMTCPRCGYHQDDSFDQLAMQPKYLPPEQLLPVHKCPNCKHLFALAPEPQDPNLKFVPRVQDEDAKVN